MYCIQYIYIYILEGVALSLSLSKEMDAFQGIPALEGINDRENLLRDVVAITRPARQVGSSQPTPFILPPYEAATTLWLPW